MDTVHTAITEPVRRLEIFNRSGPSAEVERRGQGSEFCGDRSEWRLGLRRLGLSPQQLFGRRRQLREAPGGHSEAKEVQFVPAVVDAVVPAPALGRVSAKRYAASQGG